MNIEVHKASAKDAEIIAPLFDAYRMFYKQSSDIRGALQFVQERLQQNESVIFIAFIKDKAAGFIQLYPIFTSVGMKRAWLLNDLFIHPSARGKGVATRLLDAAKDFAKSIDSKWLMLQTCAHLCALYVYAVSIW